jgi:NADPH2:quinone reductase
MRAIRQHAFGGPEEPRSEKVPHPHPADADADAAVAMVGTGRTTLAILELPSPVSGDVVLVTAAAGGIGTLLPQAA